MKEKDPVLKALEENRKAVIKQSGLYPWLMSLLAMVMLAALYFCFSLFEALDVAYSFVFLLVLLGVGFLTVPVLYGVTLSVADGTRFKGKKTFKIGQLFQQYYKGNAGAYNIWGVFWRSALTLLVSDLVFALICALIIVTAFPSLYAGFNDYVQALNRAAYSSGANPNIYDYVSGKDLLVLQTMAYSISALSIVTTTMVGGSYLRKNEEVFYAATNLVTDNRVNMVIRPLLYPFSKKVLPVVRKEHRRYNLQMNWSGYVVFYVLFFGFTVLFYFIEADSVFRILAPYIAFAIACLGYAPFYYLSRLFDALFYIAYSDKIYERLDEPTKEFIHAGRVSMAPVLRTMEEAEAQQNNKENDAGKSHDNDSSSSVYEDKDVKKPTDIAEDGTIDYTSSDKDKGDKGKDE